MRLITNKQMKQQAFLVFMLLLTCLIQVKAQVAENDFTYNIGTGFNGAVNASVLQADGKLIIGGAFTSFNGTNRNYIARLNADGTLDNMFNPGSGFDGHVHAIAIQPDGKIIVGGDFTTFNGNSQKVIIRLNTNGSHDNTFATTGSGLNNLVYGLAIQVDGKIVVGGMFTSYNGVAGNRNYIARLNSDGSLDSGLGTSFEPGTGFNSFVRCVAVQSDGSILAGGDFTSYAGTASVNYFAKLSATGTLDETFRANYSAAGKVYATTLASGGKIITVGSNSGLSEVSSGIIRRVNSNGSPDVFVTPVALVKSVIIQADGKIVYGGIFSVGIRRLTDSFATENLEAGLGFEGSSLSVNTLAIPASGQILAGGNFTSYAGIVRNRLARLKTCSSVAITTQPTNKIICVGNNTTFATVATGTGLTYKWQVNTLGGNFEYTDLVDDATYSGVTTSTLSITGATNLLSTNRYRCLVSDANCTTTSSPAILTVQAVPTISGQPNNATACVGSNTSFSVTSTGLSYKWQYDPGTGYTDWQFSGATSATLPVNSVTANMNGYKFRCIVGSCSPSVISNEAILTVNPGPAISTQPTTVSLCNSGNALFSVVATDAVSYQWQRNAANLTETVTFTGTTSATLTVAGPTTAENNTFYRCLITASNGCTTLSNSVPLYVYTTPIIATHPVDVTKCAGTSGNVTFTVAVTSPPPGLTYQWQEKVGSGSFANLTNGGVYSTVTTSTLTLTGVTAGMNGNKYRCVVGTCTTPVISFEAQLTVDSPPVVILQPVASTICAGMSTTFTTNATGLGVTFQWQKETGTGTSTYANIANGGIYSGATTETLTLTNVPVGETGLRYRCAVTASGVCAAANTSTALLTVRNPPTFNTQPINKTICEGLSTSFSSSINFNGASPVYQWQENPSGSGFVDLVAEISKYPNGVNGSSLSVNGLLTLNGNKYRLRVGSCTPEVFSNEVTLTVKQPPTITVQPVDKTICKGETVTFSVEATGSDLTYQWAGVTGSGMTTPTLTLTNVSANLNGGKIYCTVMGATGCTPVQSAEVTLTVNDLVINNQPTAVNQFCEGGNTSYTVMAEGSALTYQWQKQVSGSVSDLANDDVYSGVTTNTLMLTSVPFSMNNTAYRCIVRGTCGEINSSAVLLTLFKIPAKPNILSTTSADGITQLVVSNLDVSNPQYKWFLNGIANSNTSSSFIPSAEGSYTVQITANGCVSPISDPHVLVVTGGIQNHNVEAKSLVYPNPVSHSLTISLRTFKTGEEVSIILTNLLGQAVERTNGIGGTSKEVNVYKYASGNYLIILQQGEQKMITRFFKSN